MKKTIIYFFITFVTIPVFAQNWVSAGLSSSFIIHHINTTCVDTISNKIYAGGDIPVGTNGWTTIAIYDGNTRTWAEKDSFDKQISCVIMFNNELYVGGFFKNINSQYKSGLVKWNGSNWVNIGDSVLFNNSLSGIVKMKIINSELYVMGEFNKIGGINSSGIAKWNGVTWSSLSFPDFINQGWWIEDCALYNGYLYAGGNFITVNGTSDLAVYKNNIWQKVGLNDTLTGSSCGVEALEVYNNELYAGGPILHTEGNVGHGIQKWNGTNWSVVGTSVQDINNITNNGTVQTHKLKYYKGKLYVMGTFTYAGNILAPRIATWDGSKWCAIDRNIDQNAFVFDFCFYKDSLYLTTFDSLEHVYVNHFAKFTKGDYSYTDTCSINLNGVTQFLSSNIFFIYPNPVTNEISVNIHDASDYQNSTIIIQNTLGDVVKKLSFTKNIIASDLSQGCYFLQIIFSNGGIYKAKFIKQ